MKITLPNHYLITWSDACGNSHVRTVSQDRLAWEVERLDREVEQDLCTGYMITAIGRLS